MQFPLYPDFGFGNLQSNTCPAAGAVTFFNWYGNCLFGAGWDWKNPFCIK